VAQSFQASCERGLGAEEDMLEMTPVGLRNQDGHIEGPHDPLEPTPNSQQVKGTPSYN
jgi:hypothetical protein